MAGIKFAALGIAVLCLLVQCEIVRSHGVNRPTVYKVGDEKGWDLDPEINNWPNGKNFKEGDILVFKYRNPLYGVAKVNATEYQRCQENNKGINEGNSGNDHFTLQKGSNYFISVVPEYCGYGMKIQADLV